MIFTSYFAKLKKLPRNIVPVSICAKAPAWYRGMQYKMLAPKYGFFTVWKQTHDNGYYIDHFKREVLDRLNPDAVIDELSAMAKDHTFALLCYERPDSFCHRHLVADWFNEHGYRCEEFCFAKKEKSHGTETILQR